jgi:hypothetical protein
MMIQCRVTGQWYDPMIEFERILAENEDVLVRLKFR